MIVLDRAPYLGGRGMAVPDEGFKLNVGGHLLEDSGSGITKIFEYLGKHLGHGPSNTDMNVWDHEASRWGSIRDRYSGGKDELKKVITALLETPFEELDKWDDRPLRDWILQYTSRPGRDRPLRVHHRARVHDRALVRPLGERQPLRAQAPLRGEALRRATRSGPRRAGTGSSRTSPTR